MDNRQKMKEMIWKALNEWSSGMSKNHPEIKSPYDQNGNHTPEFMKVMSTELLPKWLMICGGNLELLKELLPEVGKEHHIPMGF